MDELIDQVLRLSGDSLPDGAAKQDIALFVKTLGVELPPLLIRLLEKANGGESILARSDETIPADLRSYTRETLWDHVLAPIATLGVDTAPFRGKLFPLGDDYSGEILAIDLGSQPAFRVLCTSGHEARKLADFQEVAATFPEFVEATVAEFQAEQDRRQPSPAASATSSLSPEDISVVAAVQSVFATRSMAVSGIRQADEYGKPQLWCVPTAAPFSFRFRFAAMKCGAAKFGYLHFNTPGGPTVVFLRSGALAAETFKNSSLANEATAAISPSQQSGQPLGFDKCRLSKNSGTIQIFETGVSTSVKPPIESYLTFVVILLKDDAVHQLKFHISGLANPGQGHDAIGLLLSFGYEWLRI